MKRLKPFVYTGREVRPKQEGIYYDAFYQQAAATNGRCMFILKQPVESERYDMGEYDGFSFEPYLEVVPLYSRGVVVDLKVWKENVKPIAKAYRVKQPTFVGLLIDGQHQTYDAKLLYDGLNALQSKQATLCFDNINRAVGIYTDEARFILMPFPSDDESTLFELTTSDITILQPDVEHWRANAAIWKHVYKGNRGLANSSSFNPDGEFYKENKSDFLSWLWEDVEAAKSLQGDFDPALVKELNELIQKGEVLLSQEEGR